MQYATSFNALHLILAQMGQSPGRGGAVGPGHAVAKQHLQSTRRNILPVKLIDGSLMMCHKHLACALV
jgi:hypothetical protein